MINKREEVFVQKWSYQRTGGILYTVIRVGLSVYILLLFGQLIYQTAIHDFSSFPFYPLFIIISIVVAIVYWVANEKRYEKLLLKKDEKQH